MIFEKLHRYRRDKHGIKGIPEEAHTPERQEEMKDWTYMGYISEYEYLGHKRAMSDTSLVVIRRDLYTTVYNLDPIPKINIDGIGGYHGGGLNTNCVAQLKRKDLLALLEYMGDKDTILMMNVDYDSKTFEYLKEMYLSVVKQG